MRVWGALLFVVVASASAAAAPSALQKECDAARGKQRAPAKASPLAIRVTKSSEPIRSVAIRRFVQCGYDRQTNKFLRAIETVYLEVLTQDRGDVQFDTKNGAQAKSYYVECQVGIAPLAQLVKGYKAPLALSCVHRIARKDGGEHDRVTGIHSYKPKGTGTFEVTAARGLTRAIRFDATVENQFETLRLDGEASGAIASSVQIFGCDPHGTTKREQPPPCP